MASKGKLATELTLADRGTAIATFKNRRYPSPDDDDKNSGIYLGPGPVPGSFYILDQFPPNPQRVTNKKGLPPGRRLIGPNASGYSADSPGDYRVIFAVPD